jgi:predicted DNA-binding transcriptional regulator YafY
MFKVDRIQEATLLDEYYHIPADFDVDAYMGSGWGAMRGGAGEPVDVVLRFEPDAGQWVSEEYWHTSQEAQVQPDGYVTFKLRIAAITPEFVNWVLYYGERVEVLQPLELRERVAEEHRRALEVYMNG